VDPAEIPGMIGEIRAAFNSDKTRSKEWRIGQLQALDQMLLDGRDELCDALMADMHKDKFQSFMQEIAMIHQEIYDAIKHLDEWMADEAVGTGLFNAPATSVIQKDPLGIALVLGAWNYNVSDLSVFGCRCYRYSYFFITDHQPRISAVCLCPLFGHTTTGFAFDSAYGGCDRCRKLRCRQARQLRGGEQPCDLPTGEQVHGPGLHPCVGGQP
jgi:hypothetical protein